ncbi:helix-turn-helix domain-containing protein [Bacillus pseudomycoides]|uniref:helix-turn-helix domain-containing protein n=1 Tax=Bacillus pseudomycoides TaxID=64104 RepID=UPI000BF61067|nr:helix-turn-helix domain-containing protein [Bacillus pseudomycoides]MED4653063.1 helix-turn-helix domain-containing protein [Bacillus pseudomycoides]PGC23533.1 helix-turn-helix domain-containing protein [Bacillus pseudomycoides]
MNFIDKRGGFFMIDNEVIDNGELDVYAFKTYAVIVRHANIKTKSAFPSLNTLTKKVGCGKKKIIECIKILVEKGYISKTLRKDGKGENLSNLYHLLPTPSISQKQDTISERKQGGVLEKLEVVTEGNTNKTNFNKTKFTGNIQDEKSGYSEEFEQVWKLYPKKIDKKLGYKSFKMATKKHSFETISLGIQRYAEYIKGNGIETKYIKHATTFFNNECYLEYVEPKKQQDFTKIFRTSNFSIDNLLD